MNRLQTEERLAQTVQTLNEFLGICWGVRLDKEKGICLTHPISGNVIAPGDNSYMIVLAMLRRQFPIA